MKKRRRHTSISYFWKEGLQNIFLHGFMSFAAVSIIVACLLITGSMALISYNIDLKINELKQDSEMVVFLDEELSQEQIDAVQDKLQKIDNVATVEFRSGAQALQAYREQLGEDAAILDGFSDENTPLRNEYHITFKDVSQTSQTVEEIDKLPEVLKHRVREDTISALIKVQQVFKAVSWGLVIALGCISVFIISNTVKLAMFSRRDEIAIQKMVGATNWFIRWPYIIEGMILGLFAGACAFFLEWAIYAHLADFVTGMLPSFEPVEFMQLYALVLKCYLAAGTGVGVGGSVLTIRRFMDV